MKRDLTEAPPPRLDSVVSLAMYTCEVLSCSAPSKVSFNPGD